MIFCANMEMNALPSIIISLRQWHIVPLICCRKYHKAKGSFETVKIVVLTRIFNFANLSQIAYTKVDSMPYHSVPATENETT